MGYVMAGSGLDVMWEAVYARNSVQHMSSGHYYARAIRAHYLSQIVVAKLLFKTFTAYFQRKEVDFALVLGAYERRMQSDALQAVEKQEILTFLSALDALTEEEVGKTGMLWLLYLRLMEYLHFFIRAERTGDWNLHIAALKLMLPVFPAAGHLNYAKSAPLHLKIAESLPNILSEDEYLAFVTNFSIRRSDKFFAGLSSDLTIEQVLMAALKGRQGVTRGRGMTDSTIATFVKTMPLCTRVSRAVKSFAGLDTETTAVHVDLRESRQRRDRLDSGKMYEWLELHSPFTKPKELLVSVSSGLSGDSTVNCLELLEVGRKMLASMAGKTFGELTLKRKDRVLSLATVTSSIKINNCVEPVNESQLFHRIVLLNLPDSELANCFAYELAPMPTSLFDPSGMMRKGNKAALAQALDQLCPPDDTVPARPKFVFDGGYLLHHVDWPRPTTFRDIAAAYITYVSSYNRKFDGTAIVVFDGYLSGPTTKDAEHARRATHTSADIVVEDGTPFVSGTKSLFLSNSANKASFIKLLTAKLQAAGIQVVQAPADADRDVVVTALEEAEWGCNAVIVGEDTDLAVLMVALTPPGQQLHMMTSSWFKGTKVRHSIPLQAALKGTAEHLLYLHATTGCDTTSYPYSKGKKVGLSKLMKYPEVKQAAEVFLNSSSTLEQISAAGEKVFLYLYGVPNQPNLTKARYFLYKRAIRRQAVNAQFKLQNLPPSPAAASLHSARVYLQVQAWKGRALPATEWGWKLCGGQLQPVLTPLDPAPERLMKLIVCNCKTCSTNTCECRKAGLRCTSICGQCAGISCENRPVDGEAEGEDVDDPDDVEGVSPTAGDVEEGEEDDDQENLDEESGSATSL
ncbi:Protein lin-54-like protein [Frankliniella fusca]|uniref:Protein lin-54-like protein n=1 Tax=Frankliniella fusca TaxID=407009 RepID=A0AAE1HXB8_9NEOP|nr:Protein lin-54-like protein [Frankliniella fusca]